MDIEAKSPLFSNFLESISGLVTIRAYGWEKSYKEKSRELLEESQKPFYLLYCVQRWLEVVVGCSVAGFAVLLVGVAVATRGKIDAGLIGVALVNIVTFSESIQGLIIHWTILETSIGAVSRIRAFTTTTENENQPSEQREPPPDWPSSGRVEFQEVVASYK
jgi:ATP-binding cassette, subfamily C (CFTR/MRP), member 1